MTARWHRYCPRVWLTAVGCGVSLAWAALAGETQRSVSLTRPPRIDPDYSGIVLPPNIAPLNFVVVEPGIRYEVVIRSKQGAGFAVSSGSGKVLIPRAQWQGLLRANAGQELWLAVSVLTTNGIWHRFETITNRIAREPIDRYLVYRLLHPQYSTYASGTMGIYQRNLENYDESVVLEIKELESKAVCLNCHTFALNRPETMALQIRATGRAGKPMLVVRNGRIDTVAKTTGYLAWHPSGKLIAYSMNKLSLFFHTVGENRDVFDHDSDLGVYRVDSNKVETPAAIARPDRRETWPAWSPDGRFLYFCSGPQMPISQYDQARYDLMRIPYDIAKDTWGDLEPVLLAQDTHLSIAQPKISPDGRFLVFCMSDHGNFPVYQPGSDLYLMDLSNRQYRKLELNSDLCDSWHGWSSNSRWLVFSSKRRDGLLSRPHFGYIDEQGHAAKPFLLPQQDPTFYDFFLKTYNVPELVTGPVPVSRRDLFTAVFHPGQRLRPEQDASPSAMGQIQSDETKAAGAYHEPAPK